MLEFILFGLFITLGVASLVIWPILLHPTLPPRKKIIASVMAFAILVPLGLLLYAWLGVPAMAN